MQADGAPLGWSRSVKFIIVRTLRIRAARMHFPFVSVARHNVRDARAWRRRVEAAVHGGQQRWRSTKAQEQSIGKPHVLGRSFSPFWCRHHRATCPLPRKHTHPKTPSVNLQPPPKDRDRRGGHNGFQLYMHSGTAVLAFIKRVELVQPEHQRTPQDNHPLGSTVLLW